MSEFGRLDGREKRGTIGENEESFHELSVEVSEELQPDSPSESDGMPSPPQLTGEPVEVEIHFEPPPSYEEALSMKIDKRRKTR